MGKKVGWEVKRHLARKGLKGWKGDENRRQEGGRRRVCIIGGRECESAEGEGGGGGGNRQGGVGR